METKTSRFLKVRTNRRSNGGARTVVLQVLAEGPSYILGRPVDPKTGEDRSYLRKDGVVVDKQEMIFREAIAWTRRMAEDLKYGGLVPAGKRQVVVGDCK
jgi:hypothetical protein